MLLGVSLSIYLYHISFNPYHSVVIQAIVIVATNQQKMKLILNLSLERFKGILSPEEHADMVSMLLAQQVFTPDDMSININTPNPDSALHTQLLLKLRQKIYELELSCANCYVCKFHSGALILTQHSKVVGPCQKGENIRSRKPAYGNVLYQSEYYPGFWLIHFFATNKYYYCQEKVIKFESPAGVTSLIDTTTRKNAMKPCNLRYHSNKDEQDLILLFVLINKMHRTPELS